MNSIYRMKEEPKKIKLSYVTGLRDVVMTELSGKPHLCVVGEGEDSIYITFSSEQLPEVKGLRSVARAYLTIQGFKLHPAYLSNHKSIVGEMLDVVLSQPEEKFRSFKLTCAGSDSAEVRGIAKYIEETYGLREEEEADAKVHIIKIGDVWEIGVQVTPRPLSVRNYRVRNMSGAMDPTVAYAVNSLGNLENAKSYLNVFSGSATLLIEAAQCYPNLEKCIGFDIDKKHLSLSLQNIKEAGLIERAEVKEGDIFDKPSLGTFDVITSDLPFGMVIGKGEDLEYLYKTFVEYCENSLNQEGRLVCYTSEHEILERHLSRSKFKVTKTLNLKFMTSVDAYLRPKIIVCEFK